MQSKVFENIVRRNDDQNIMIFNILFELKFCYKIIFKHLPRVLGMNGLALSEYSKQIILIGF